MSTAKRPNIQAQDLTISLDRSAVLTPSTMSAGSNDKLLFTPGPLSTSSTVKQAMLHDLGSRDVAFIETVRQVRTGLLALGHVSEPDYTTVIMQGSGTFGVEATLGTAVPRDGKILIAANGAYGQRLVQIAKVLGISHQVLEWPESDLVEPAKIEAALVADSTITHVAVVHSETTTGLLNPIDQIGNVTKKHGRLLIVDAMSSFGGVPINIATSGIDYLVSSSNKCVEGVPGFSYVIARRAALSACEGNARSLSLDLLAQLKGLDGNGQFRFTPPTHALLAFKQALTELHQEGGVTARHARYSKNHEVLMKGMTGLGFQTFLTKDKLGPIITSFCTPKHPNFSFETFYQKLSELGFVIYPGKVSKADCFRIGTIGQLHPHHFEALVEATVKVLRGMGVSVPVE